MKYSKVLSAVVLALTSSACSNSGDTAALALLGVTAGTLGLAAMSTHHSDDTSDTQPSLSSSDLSNPDDMTTPSTIKPTANLLPPSGSVGNYAGIPPVTPAATISRGYPALQYGYCVRAEPTSSGGTLLRNSCPFHVYVDFIATNFGAGADGISANGSNLAVGNITQIVAVCRDHDMYNKATGMCR